MGKYKSLLIAVIGLLLSSTSAAEVFEYEGIYYNSLTETTAEVGQNSYAVGDVVIPDYVSFGGKQLKVTAIGRNAFTNWNPNEVRVTSVRFPADITSIGEGAFYGQKGITEFKIPQTVEFIGYRALAGTGITTVEMSHQPRELQFGVFSDCTSLTRAVMPAEMTELPGWMFENCQSLKEVQLPSTLTKICSAAFMGCSALESFTMPDSLSVVESSVFARCTSLRELRWSQVLHTLDGYLFDGCTNLAEIELPASVTSIPSSCFINCVGLRKVVIPSTVTELGYQAFEGCTALEEVAMADGIGIKSLESYVFKNCRSLKHLAIPAGVTTIYNNAFEGAGLTDIVLSPQVERLYEQAFAGCTSLTDVYLQSDKLDALSSWSEVFCAATRYFGTLHVAEGQKNRYSHLEVWKDFANIVEENTSGREYCLVNISCANHDFLVNGGAMEREAHLEMEKGQPLVISLPEEDTWYSTNRHRYLSAVLVNGEERLADVADGQLDLGSVEEDLDIEVVYDTYNVSLAIYQGQEGGLEFLTELRGKTAITVMPASGYKAEAKWGPWHETYQWEPWYETDSVDTAKTYNLQGEYYNDQEISVTYQKK